MDWDAYRSVYGDLDFAAKQRHYDEVFRDHPAQEHHNAEAVDAFLATVPGDKFVIELGGWRGELAAKMLARHPDIYRWRNYDFCLPAIRASVCDDPRFDAIGLHDYFWNVEVGSADVFVAAHVIEHFTRDELLRLIDALDATHVYLEAPLLRDGQTWDGYFGDHILDADWPWVHAAMAAAGYELVGFARFGDATFDSGAATYRRG